VLFRLARGSGLAGLGAMARVTPLGDVWLTRPLLDLSKARLMATLAARKIAFAEDPSNADVKYTRVRWRKLMPNLALEGLHAQRLAAFAVRMRRANAAIDTLVDAVAHRVTVAVPGRSLALDAGLFAELPEEVGLRLIGRAIAAVGHEGTVELGKLEALVSALGEAVSANVRFRRTLAGAMITFTRDRITVEGSPARRNQAKSSRKASSKA